MSVSNTIRGRGRGSQPNPDDLFTRATMEGSSKTAQFNPSMEITEGPFARHNPSDPVSFRKEQREMGAEEVGATGNSGIQKEALMGAGGSGGDSPSSVPGMSRALQQPQGPLGGTGPVYGSDTDEQHAYDAPKMEVSSGPKQGQGVKATTRKLLKKVEKNTTTDEKGSPLTAPLDVPKSAISPKDKARTGNIDADSKNMSAWTASGAGGESTMHSGQMKLSFAEESSGEDAVDDDAGDLEDDVFDDDDVTEPDREVEPITEDEDESEPPPAAAISMDEKTASARLRFAGVPVELVDDPLALFVPCAREKTASSSREYFARGDAHPLTLSSLLGSEFGTDWYDWEPETISETIVRQVGVDPSPTTMNKIMALKMLRACPDKVLNDWRIIEKVSVAFDGDTPSMNEIEDVAPEQLSHAFSLMKAMCKKKPSEDVSKYVAARLYDAGYVITPATLGFSDHHLRKLVDDEPLRKKVLAGYGKALKGAAPAADSENPVDIQVNRLMANHAYVLDKLDESVSQLG
jgi:hypothetical protein